LLQDGIFLQNASNIFLNETMSYIFTGKAEFCIEVAEKTTGTWLT
jgi:hypothetical protein